MSEAHSILRSLGIIAAVFSVYRGLTMGIPHDDIIAILAICLALIWLGNDLEKRKARKKQENHLAEETAPALGLETIAGLVGN